MMMMMMMKVFLAPPPLSLSPLLHSLLAVLHRIDRPGKTPSVALQATCLNAGKGGGSRKVGEGNLTEFFEN